MGAFVQRICRRKSRKSRKVVICVNLQRSTPGKQIFSLLFDKSLKVLLTRYEKVIILGDFEIEAENKVMKDFL